MDNVLIVISTLILIGLPIIACLLLIAYQIRQLPKSATVNVTVPPAGSPIIKVVVPSDIEKARQDSHRIDIGQRQPDGSYQWIGQVDVLDPWDRSTWPARLEQELATPGRALKLPDGTVDEGFND